MFNSKQPTFLFAVGAAVTTCCVSAASGGISWTGIGDAGAYLEAGAAAVTLSSKEFPGSAVASSGAGSALAEIGTDRMALTASSGGMFGASVALDAVAFVDSDTTFTASWRNLAERSVSLQIVRISSTNAILDIVMSTDASDGFDHVELQSGNYYRFLFEFASTGNFASSRVDASFAPSGVPAPGALALLGTAGIVARRRRA